MSENVIDISSSSENGSENINDSDSESTISYEISSDEDDIAESPSKRKAPSPDINDAKKRPSDDGDLGYRLTTVSGLSKSFNDPALALSLRTVIAGSSKFGRLLSSVQFNFLFDIDWMIDHYPKESSTSPILIVHGFRGSDEAGMKITASPYPQISLAQAKLDSPYGTHHSKMMILEYERGLRLVIHTANMIEQDWHQKTQAVWTSPLLTRRPSPNYTQSSAFLSAYSQYLLAYNLAPLKEWAEKLKQFDFSAINDEEIAFIGSVPGRHSGANLNSFGHTRLKDVLSKRANASYDMSSQVRIVCQFSSIGSLGESADKWLIPELISSCLAAFPPTKDGAALKSTVKPRPILVYPTVSDVRQSLEGYAAGGSLPYRKEVASKQKWLNSMLHCWRAAATGRSRAMPHVKTFSAVSLDFAKIYWLLVTSANLSKAAWGKLEKNDSQLCILSYEAGVLMLPKKTGTDQEDGREQPFWSSGQLLLPFDLPPQPYARNDEPWVADQPQSQRDSHGRTWMV